MSCGCNNQTGHTCGENPCSTTDTNTAACESLPSQISNFTAQFFGEVVKTEVGGVVGWSLPCSLDVGLPANPRGSGEGLACYFLRLFGEGIIGLKGDTGAQGEAGTDGHSAYSVTLQSFAQPTLGAPNVTVLSAYNPAILAGMTVFISTSGHYFVNNADVSGALSLTLTNPVDGASGAITAGKLVVPSGYPGATVVGPVGPTGATGPAGPAGTPLTTTNVDYFATVGSDYPLPVLYAAIDFTNSSPALLLPSAGKYLLTACVALLGKAGVVDADVTSVKLRNTSQNTDVSGSEKTINFVKDTQKVQVVVSIPVITTLANQTVAIFGKCTTNAKVYAVALETTLTAVRIE